MRSLSKKNRLLFSDPKAKLYLLAAALIPVILLLICAWFLKLAPFGTAVYFPESLQDTYLPVVSELRRKILSGESLNFTWNSAGGTNFLSLIASYAASPWNLLYLCFSETSIPAVTEVIFVLKVVFASVGFCLLLWKKENLLSPLSVAFSVAYALSAFMITYYEEPWLLDAAALLPFMALGLYYLIRGKHQWLFSVSLALTLISSFQIALYVIVFVFILFLLFIMEARGEAGFNRLRRTIWKEFALHFIIGLGISSFIWFPAIRSLLTSTVGNETINLTKDIDMRLKIWDIFERLSFDAYPFQTSEFPQYPSMYCGIFSVLGVCLYCFSKIRFKEKMYTFCGLLLMYLLMGNKFLGFFMNFGHFPVTSIYPQAFMLIFLIMYMAGRAISSDGLQIPAKFLQASVVILFSYMIIQVAISKEVDYSHFSIYMAVAFLVAYYICVRRAQIVPDQKTFWVTLLSAVMVTECAVGFIHPLKKRYIVRSMKNAVEDTEFSAATAARKSLVPNKGESQWVYELSGSVTYHEPDESIKECFESARHDLEPGGRVLLAEADIKNYGLRFGVPSLDSTYYMQDRKYALTLNKLGISSDPEMIDPDDDLSMFMRQLFHIRTRLNNEDLLCQRENTDETSSLGYFTSSEDIYGSFDHSLSSMEAQRRLISIFSEGDPYQEESLKDLEFCNVTRNEDRTLQVSVKDGEMSEAEFEIEAAYNTPIYLYCNATQKLIYEVTHYDSEGKEVFNSSKRDAQGKIIKLEETVPDGVKRQVRILFSTPKKEKVRFQVFSANEKNMQSFRNTMNDAALQITTLNSSRVEGDIYAPTSGTLFFTVPYDSAWKVTVDGYETSTFRACETFLAIHLTEGGHQVTMEYEPFNMTENLLASAVFMILAFALSGSVNSGKKKSKEKKQEAVVTDERTDDRGEHEQ